jgi:hypothetical protein
MPVIVTSATIFPSPEEVRHGSPARPRSTARQEGVALPAAPARDDRCDDARHVRPRRHVGAFHKIVFGSAFADAWRDYVGLAAFAMAFNMTVPMVLWMRYRGHSWERGGEMATAMNLPLPPLLLLYSLDLIPAPAVLGLQMMLMIPAMVLAMLYRKEEYSATHQTAWHPYRKWFAGAH